MSLIQMNWNPPRHQLRQFGGVCLLVFGLLGGLIYFKQTFLKIHLTIQMAHALGIALMMLGLLCALMALLAPALLRPLYVGLSVIGLPIGFVVSFVVLAIMFYGIIFPLGVIMRLIGRDTMQRTLRPELTTYWQPRAPVTDSRRYFRQS